MNALSVRQPYAELIAAGRKTLEIRSWKTDYRGPLLIVASQRYDEEAGARWRLMHQPCGFAICLVDLVDVELTDRMSWAWKTILKRACCWIDPNGIDYAWRLENPRRVHPLAVKGRLRLFPVDEPIHLVMP